MTWLLGDAAQCDLWFPPKKIPLEDGSKTLLSVLVDTCAHSRFMVGRMIATRHTQDLLLGMWMLLQRLGRVPRRLIWDNDSRIGRGKRHAEGVGAFTGTLATTLSPPLSAPTRALPPDRDLDCQVRRSPPVRSVGWAGTLIPDCLLDCPVRRSPRVRSRLGRARSSPFRFTRCWTDGDTTPSLHGSTVVHVHATAANAAPARGLRAAVSWSLRESGTTPLVEPRAAGRSLSISRTIEGEFVGVVATYAHVHDPDRLTSPNGERRPGRRHLRGTRDGQ